MKITLKHTIAQELEFKTPSYRANSLNAVAILEDAVVCVTRIAWQLDDKVSTWITVEDIDLNQPLDQSSKAGRSLLESDYQEITKDQFFERMEKAQNDLMAQLLKIKIA